MFIKAIHTIQRDPKASPAVIPAGKVFNGDLLNEDELNYLLRPDVRAAVEASDDDLIKAGLKLADEDHEAEEKAAAEAAAKEAEEKAAAEAAAKEAEEKAAAEAAAKEAEEKAAAEAAAKEAEEKAAAEAAAKEAEEKAAAEAAAKKKGGKKTGDDESLV